MSLIDCARRLVGSTAEKSVRRAAALLVLAAFAAAVGAAGTPIASAVVPEAGTFAVRAIGDSVTAGFGYCGAADPACTDGYLQPATALGKCLFAKYLDACSANLGAYAPGAQIFPPPVGVPGGPVSWADQFAVREGMSNYANLAVTGSTPAQWWSGELSGRLDEVVDAKPKLTLLTLGANPVLRAFYTSPRNIACLFSPHPFEPEARLLQRVRGCALREFIAANSRNALIGVYRKLLTAGENHVLVLGYHSPWPAVLHHYVRKNEVVEILDTLNEQIDAAVASVAADYPGRISIVAVPAWGEHHQCLAEPPAARWVINLDFCIHPSRAGYTEMMERVIEFARAHPQALGLADAAWVS